MLDFLKCELEAGKYDRLMEGLSEEIRLGDVRDLLTRREVGSRLRRVVKVKKESDD